MSKPYYADYVNHILRFYFRYDCSKGFKNDVDKTNYLAADKVIRKLSDTDRQIMCTIFNLDGVNVADNIMVVAKRFHEDHKALWSLVSTTTAKIAKERKLL